AFKAFDFGSGARNLHIVGEAYSDYQGFIEGALNSAELALATLPAVAVDPALQEPGLGRSCAAPASTHQRPDRAESAVDRQHLA
ncbi:hypothetical protein ABTH92_21070, partial [Acinetobacter baumannii]